MRVVIVDLCLGNFRSVLKAFERLQVPAVVSSRQEEILRASKLVLPGVGHFKQAMENLHRKNLVDALSDSVLKRQIPILGICLGMQMLSRWSEEGNLAGMGWLDAITTRFDHAEERRYPIPHMGWNRVEPCVDSPLFHGIEQDDEFYFAHSYHLVCPTERSVLATTTYGIRFPSAVRVDNIWGVQFHPEKSHRAGLKVLENFCCRV